MEKVRIPDAAGETLTCLKYRGVEQLMNPFLQCADLFSEISKMPLREDDIILCSFPRTGCHWTWELLQMITTGKTEVDSARDKDSGMLEFRWFKQKEMDDIPSPRILSTHLWPAQLPEEATQRKTKLVFVCRNPKDVCVSWYMFHKEVPLYEYKGEFANWIQQFLDGNVDWGSYTDWAWEWEKMMEQHPDHSVHFVTYEGLKKNPIEELSKLSKFLGKDCDVSFLQAASDACALERIRSQKIKCHERFQKAGIKDGANLMYRQGKVGGWKEWFTVAQSEQFDLQWSKAMEGSKFFSFLQTL